VCKIVTIRVRRSDLRVATLLVKFLGQKVNDINFRQEAHEGPFFNHRGRLAILGCEPLGQFFNGHFPRDCENVVPGQSSHRVPQTMHSAYHMIEQVHF